MRFDISQDSLIAKGYLAFYPSEDVTLNFQINIFSFDEAAFQSVPNLLINYMDTDSFFSSLNYLIYFGISCICLLLLLALTINSNKETLLTRLDARKKAIIHCSFFDKATHWFKDNAVYLIAIAVPCLLFIVSMLIFSCEPFGNQSFLDEDGYPSVLAGALGYYHNLKDGNTTLSMLMGYATNIYSPSNTVYAAFLLPFSASAIPGILLLSEAVLLGLCGFSIVYYLTHRLTGPTANKKDPRLLVPAFLYTLNAFMLAMHSYLYSWYLLFFILPLLILSFERLIYQKKWFGYTMLLALSIFTNINIALYLCIFLILYFFTYKFNNFADCIRKGLRFAFFSILSAVCSLCNIIPILIGITGSGYNEADSVFPSFGFHGSFLEQWKKLMIFSPSGAVTTNDGGINLYMSILCLILLFVFFTSQRVSLRRKLTYGLLSIFLLFSFNEQILSYLWNGFHYQSNVPNRYVFLLVFICSIMAFDALPAIRRQSILKMSLICLSAAIFLTLCQFLSNGNALFCYVCSLILILLYLLVHLICTKFPKYRRFYHPIMLFILLGELSANWFYTCTTFGLTSPIPYGNYEAQIEINTSLLEDSNDFSRVCTPATFCMNTGNFTNTPNGNVFISTLSTYQQALNSLFGNCGGSNFIYSNYDSTPWGQSLAANEYISVPFYAAQALRDLEQYEYIGYANENYIFRNPNALHLGFYISNDLIEQFDAISLPDFMNIMTDDFTDNHEPLLTPLKLSINTGKENSITFLNDNFEEISISEADSLITAAIAKNSLSSAISSIYLKIDFIPSKSGQIYLSMNEFICLGYFEAGEKASITIPYPNKTPDISDEYMLYIFDHDVYEKFIEEVSKNQLENIEIHDNVITATSDYQEDGYTMLSLPYDKNWKAYIDDIEVPVDNLLNSAVFIQTPAGRHEIRLVYDVTFYRICTWISLITTLTTILIYFISKCRHTSKAK
ncbi:MAG: YfhO family protein [Lachnospiraceae bacterium]